MQVSEQDCEREVKADFKYAVGLSLLVWLSVQVYLSWQLWRFFKASGKTVGKGGAPKE